MRFVYGRQDMPDLLRAQEQCYLLTNGLGGYSSLSAAFSMSRGKAADLIAAGKVALDHMPCIKCDKAVGEESVVTARGFGKAVVRECSRVSKKGRIILVIDRYI